MQQKDGQKLLKKYLTGQCSEEEKVLLETWYARHEDKDLPEIPQHITDQSMADVWSRLPVNRQPAKIKLMWPRIAAIAASVLLIAMAGRYFLSPKVNPVQQIVLLKPGVIKNDALPGDKAILTLGDGKQVVVTDLPKGKIDNTNIQKTANGRIVYQEAGSEEAPLIYNTYTVPRGGGKHELRLADGTLAVLDAGSSIRFPVAFNGTERRVEMSGQVYFEVVHNPAKPFFVTAKHQTIEDLGTHFNIYAFDDEPGMKTTLLEGSISIAGTLLKPGQQAVHNATGDIRIVNNVNIDEEVAWKNNLFMFTSNTLLTSVMNELSRWYDLEVIYQGSNKKYHFGGDIPRNSKLSEVLRILSYNGVQFALDGKKIIVYQ